MAAPQFPILVAVAIALASLAAAPDEPDALLIEAGRLSVMVDQSAEALKLLAPAVEEPALGVAEPHADAFAETVAAVRRYNLVAAQACRLRVTEPALCQGPFRPAWLDRAAPPAETELRVMLDAAGDRIVPLWRALCAKAKPLSRDESFCQLE